MHVYVQMIDWELAKFTRAPLNIVIIVSEKLLIHILRYKLKTCDMKVMTHAINEPSNSRVRLSLARLVTHKSSQRRQPNWFMLFCLYGILYLVHGQNYA